MSQVRRARPTQLAAVLVTIALATAPGCEAPSAGLAAGETDLTACLRVADGLDCARWSGRGFGTPTRWTTAFSDADGWDVALPYWGTIRSPDLDGDGRSDVCGRGAAGLTCAVRAATTGFLPAVTSSAFSDEEGFGDWSFAGTLQFPDLDGDHRADACARGPEGLVCARGLGDGRFGPAALVDGGFFSDARGWGDEPSRFGTLAFGDLDGDGRADACMRGSDGVYCALSAGDRLAAPARFTPEWGDQGADADETPAPELALVDVTGDHRVDLCARGPRGVSCAASVGVGFAPSTVWTTAAGSAPRDGAPPASDALDADDDAGRLRYGDLDGDGRADLCLVDGAGVRCALSTGERFGPLALWDGGALASGRAVGWTLGGVRLVDLDANGRVDLCADTSDGLLCTLSSGRAFEHAAVSRLDHAWLVGTDTRPGIASAPIERPVAGSGATHPTARENARPGTPGWWVPYPQQALKHEVEGYTDEPSYPAGARVRVRLATAVDGEPVEWSVYRTGYYQGVGARRVARGSVVGHRRTLPLRGPKDVPVRAGWPVSFELTLPSSAVSGVYLLRLDSRRLGRSHLSTFVVRDDQRAADLVVDRADFTDAAYNNWDGQDFRSSLYLGGKQLVSFDRPLRSSFATGANTAYSSGYFAFEYSFVRWLEKEGYDVKYVSNWDLHSNAAALDRARAFLSIGHDEYWSTAMRDHVEAARERGMHLGFFGGDMVDGIVDLAPGDPHSFTRTRNGKAMLWRDRPVDSSKPPRENPSDTLTGTHYGAWCAAAHAGCARCYWCAPGEPFERFTTADDFQLAAGVRHPALRGLGATRRLPHALGYEYEVPYSGAARLPVEPVVLAEAPSVRIGAQRPAILAWQGASGGRGFNVGSMHWAHALERWAGRAAFRLHGGERACAPGERDCFDHESRAVRQVTANVLADFGATPATPSYDLAPSEACDWSAPAPGCERAATDGGGDDRVRQ